MSKIKNGGLDQYGPERFGRLILLYSQKNAGLKGLIKILFYCIKSKVVPYSITSIGHGADPGFLAVSLQVTLVINPVVGCGYFLSQRDQHLGRYQITLLSDRGTQV